MSDEPHDPPEGRGGRGPPRNSRFYLIGWSAATGRFTGYRDRSQSAAITSRAGAIAPRATASVIRSTHCIALMVAPSIEAIKCCLV